MCDNFIYEFQVFPGLIFVIFDEHTFEYYCFFF